MSTTEHRPLPVWAWFLIGVGAGVVGLLPWLVTGARLPLQNLAVDQSVSVAPFVLLPFSQYALTTIVALLVVGGAAAGIAGRSLRRRYRRFGTVALLGGTLLVQIVAAVQASVVTVRLLERSSRSAVYAGAVVAVIVVSLAVSVLVLLLVARAPVPGAVIGLSLAAIVAPSWIGAALHDLLVFGPTALTQPILLVLRWLPAVLVGAAIAWGGLRSGGRIIAAIVSLAALWVGPAFFTAVSSVAGSRVLAPYPGEMLASGMQIFGQALTIPEIFLPPLVIAAVIGVAGAFLFHRGRGTGESAPAAAVTAEER